MQSDTSVIPVDSGNDTIDLTTPEFSIENTLKKASKVKVSKPNSNVQNLVLIKDDSRPADCDVGPITPRLIKDVIVISSQSPRKRKSQDKENDPPISPKKSKKINEQQPEPAPAPLTDNSNSYQQYQPLLDNSYQQYQPDPSPIAASPAPTPETNDLEHFENNESVYLVLVETSEFVEAAIQNNSMVYPHNSMVYVSHFRSPSEFVVSFYFNFLKLFRINQLI
jgi:hypothetical protein